MPHFPAICPFIYARLYSATFGIENHGLQSLGNTIGTIAFRLFTQASQAAASCWMQMQEARQHGSPYRQYATFPRYMSLYLCAAV